MSVLRKKDTDMTEGGIIGHLLLFAVPLLVGNLFQQLYNTVDSIVVGNYVGKEALAAVGSVSPIINMLIGVFVGLSSGAGVVISQHYGARDWQRVHDAVQTTMALTLVLCAVMTTIGVAMVPLMLKLMQTPSDVWGQSEEYLLIYFGGLSGLVLYNIGAGILRAVGDSRRPLYYLIASALTNTILDVVFVRDLHMGIAGAAWATVLSQCLSAAMVIVTLMRSDSCYRIEWKKLRFHRQLLRRILAIGLPTAVQQAVTAFSNVFVQSYINRFGSSCMAGWTSYQKIDAVALLPMQSLAIAATTFTGQNIGAGNRKRARKGTFYAIWLTVAITGAIIAPLMIFAPQLIRLFNRDAEVLYYGTFFIRVISPFYLLGGTNQVLAGSLRGAGAAKAPMYIMLGCFVLFRQIYLFVTYRLFGTLLLVSMGYPFGWTLCSILMLLYYFRGKWDVPLDRERYETKERDCV